MVLKYLYDVKTNRPFYTCELSIPAFECSNVRLRLTLLSVDTNLVLLLMKVMRKNDMIYIIKQEEL